MRLKIKVKPEDFMVEEIAFLPLVNEGDYGAYLLKKNGWNTIDLLLELARRLNIPFTRFSYGGRKDRYALTSQYNSIKSPGFFDLREKNYSLTRVGVMERPMGPDLIRRNRFEITVRKLNREDVDKISSLVQDAGSTGYPNYFDDQRFGSFDSRQGFFAEKS
jgi:tRNA pseudouridine13 synthase